MEGRNTEGCKILQLVLSGDRGMGAKRCPKCNAVVGEGDRFCGKCGAPLSALHRPRSGPRVGVDGGKPAGVRVCPACGKDLSPESVLCMACGTFVKTGTEAEAAPAKPQVRLQERMGLVDIAALNLKIGGVIFLAAWVAYILAYGRAYGTPLMRVIGPVRFLVAGLAAVCWPGMGLKLGKAAEKASKAGVKSLAGIAFLVLLLGISGVVAQESPARAFSILIVVFGCACLLPAVVISLASWKHLSDLPASKLWRD